MSTIANDAMAAATCAPTCCAIAELIQPGEKVLDLGCGDGSLLRHLIDTKQIIGRGVEIAEAEVLACVRNGVTVRQGDLHEGLRDYPGRLVRHGDPELDAAVSQRSGVHHRATCCAWGSARL